MLEHIIKAAEKSNPRQPGDYEKNGLLHCGNCHTPKQCRVNVPWGPFIAHCQCQCRKEAYEREQAEEKKKEAADNIQRLRINGIADKSISGMTFDTDDGSNPKKTDLARRYVAKWEKLRSDNVGLLFYGNTGTGKTFCAGCIANALIDRQIPVLMTSFPKIINQITAMMTDKMVSSEEKASFVASMDRFDLLIIDDLGAERQSGFALEWVYEVIDRRYKAKKPLIITTNLDLAELRNPQDMTYKRVYDRVLEMCMPILFDGESRRKALAQNKLDRAKNILMGTD